MIFNIVEKVQISYHRAIQLDRPDAAHIQIDI